MRARVGFSLSGGGRADLGPGDLIGRVATAALAIDDPRVSEAHAMVSLRRGELYLLSLRRMVAVRGRPVSEVLLEPGAVIELADGLALTVETVAKPARVPALAARGLGVRPLGSVASILAGPPPRVVGRFVPGAEAHVWSAGDDAWRIRVGDGPVRELAVGDEVTVAGLAFRMSAVDLASLDHASTQGAGGIASPLHLVAHYDCVELRRSDRPVVTVSGVGARLISELVAMGGPVAWEVVARELWRDAVDAGELRRRWDVTLNRLRARLREAGVRADLVRSDGAGQVQLVLHDADRVDDRS